MSQEASINSQEKNNQKLVIISYGKWFLGFLALTAIAILCAYLINNFYSFSPILKDVLQLFGFSFTFAALGKRGYDIQTWGGESPAEKLNERIFLVLSFAGVFLIIFSH